MVYILLFIIICLCDVIYRVKTPEVTSPKVGRRMKFKAAVDAVMAVEKMTNAAAALDAASHRRCIYYMWFSSLIVVI